MMDFDALRNKLLAKAIRGELVPQLDSEPRVDSSRYHPDEQPFLIPSKWQWFCLLDLVSILPARDYQIKIKDIQIQGRFPVISQSQNWIDGYTDQVEKALPKNRLPILIFGDHTRVVKLIDFPFVVGADGTKLLSSKNDIVDIKYLYFVLDYYSKSLRNRGYARHFSILKKMPIPVPPKQEQQRIINKLTRSLADVQYAQESFGDLQTLEVSLKNKILQLAFHGKLVPQLESEPVVEQMGDAPKDVPFFIPEKWKWVRLSEVCTYIQRGKSPKYSHVKKIPVIAQKCNQWDGFHIEKAQFIEPETLPSYKQERKLQDGDVLWNSTGLGTLGRLAVYYHSLNPYGIAVADSHVTVCRVNKRFLDSKFLYWYLRNPSVQNEIEDIADGTTKQKELATKTIRNYLIPLPPVEEQHRIVKKIDILLKEMNKFSI